MNWNGLRISQFPSGKGPSSAPADPGAMLLTFLKSAALGVDPVEKDFFDDEESGRKPASVGVYWIYRRPDKKLTSQAIFDITAGLMDEEP